MTIARDTLAAYLDEQFSHLAAAIDQDADVEIGYKPDIDNALRKLGTSEGALATATVGDTYRDAYFALAEYYALERFQRQLGDRVNRTTGEVSYNFAHQLAAVEKMLLRAERKLALFGYDVTGSAWRIVDYNTDWLEPQVTL